MKTVRNSDDNLTRLRDSYPEKFVSENQIFSNIHRGAKIFVGTACGEPQSLIRALTTFVESNPKVLMDTEVFQVWSLGVATYAEPKFKANFRHNSFFIGDNTRGAINQGMADYTPVFLSQVPELLHLGLVEVDVALIQVSPPDEHGYVSLGVSVDIVKAATEEAKMVVAQINRHMPRVHGDGFLHAERIDYFVEYDEPLLEYRPKPEAGVADEIGRYVSRLIQDGDTIQVGYGATPNSILMALSNKKHLGLHSELFSDGLAELIRKGVIDNSRKTLNPGKSIAAFCMGTADTYGFINDNPQVEFRSISYTNNPMNIARQHHMVAINSALAVDLTGQATAESLGQQFYSGIGGQADFMRGAVLAPGGRSILTLPSTAKGGAFSRIVPMLPEGSGVTLNRGDIHYVVTEYGIAYLHGKNVRDRAMSLISIAHPKFRAELIQEAKRLNLIYRDQAFVPGKRGEYPVELETLRRDKLGGEIFLRPVRINDESLLKDFFYDLSDNSLYRRFISMRRDIPHERLQEFCVIDYTKEMVVLVIDRKENLETVIGMGQYSQDEVTHTAEVAFVVRDEYHNRGIGSSLLRYLTFLAKKQGLLGFTAEVLVENKPMMHVFEKAGFEMSKARVEGVYELKMMFRD